MNILVCVKRVPMVGSRITLLEDETTVDTKHLGFTISPHEECAVEEAVRLIEVHGGSVTVLTLGPPEAVEQLRDAAALGATHLVHLVTDDREWDPIATANALAVVVGELEREGETFDLILFGNEAPDTGDYQVGVRVAHGLGRQSVSGIKSLAIVGETVTVSREFRGGDELYELSTPCVVAVREGLNLPRYPSLPGRMRAKKLAVNERTPSWRDPEVRVVRLRTPVQGRRRAEIIGEGVEAVPALVALLDQLGVLA